MKAILSGLLPLAFVLAASATNAADICPCFTKALIVSQCAKAKGLVKKPGYGKGKWYRRHGDGSTSPNGRNYQ